MSGAIVSSLKCVLNRTSYQVRYVATTHPRFYKKVVVDTKDNTTTIEAIDVPDASEKVPLLSCKDRHLEENHCPLCPKRVPRVKYTDVLILSQFLDKGGKQLPMHVTGLCRTAHNLLKRNILLAQTAGLIKRPPDHPDNFFQWNKYNIYFEE